MCFGVLLKDDMAALAWPLAIRMDEGFRVGVGCDGVLLGIGSQEALKRSRERTKVSRTVRKVI